jgi:hypothetical protein
VTAPLSTAAAALLARLNLKAPEPGAKFAADVVERALESVPPKRRAIAVADLKWHGFMQP